MILKKWAWQLSTVCVRSSGPAFLGMC